MNQVANERRHAAELNRLLPLSAAQIEAYGRDGYLRLKDVLSPALLDDYRAEIMREVRAWTPARFIEQLRIDNGDKFAAQIDAAFTRKKDRITSTYSRAFTQRMNLWRLNPTIATLVKSKRLACLAAGLMQVEGVRLYHDQALFKEPHGGHTPWHVDQYYWPLSSDHTITLWIPLQAVDQAMGPLAFAAGSHLSADAQARRLAISDQSEAVLAQQLKDADVDQRPFALGEVSFHAGWTCHRAGPNLTDTVRAAFTIIYMDKDIRVTAPQHAQQATDARMWLPGCEPGAPAASAINPQLC